MHKTRLWVVLSAIPLKETKALLLFVKGNITDPNQILLMRLLRNTIIAQKNISRAVVWTKLWGNQPYDDVRLRLACSELLHTVENFLLLQSLDNLIWERDRRLCDFFIQNSNPKLALTYHNKTLLSKKNYPHRDTHFFYNTLLDNEIELSLQDLLDTAVLNLTQTDIDLDKTFVLGKLKNAVLKYWATVVGNIQQENLLLTEVIAAIATTDYLANEPVISIYYNLYLLFVEDKKELLPKISETIKNTPYISKSEAASIYLMIENYISIGIRQQRYDYNDLIRWYEQGSEQDMLYTNSGTILSARLQNIINAYIFTQQYEKGLAFLETHRLRIVVTERETTYNLNLGHLYFYLKRYTEVSALVLPITPDFPVLYLTAQRILLKTYYATQAYDRLDTALDTYQHYLYATKRIIAPHNREGNLNFVKILRYVAQAAGLRNRPSRMQVLAKAQKIITKGSFMSDKTWLNDQITVLQ